MDQHCPWRLMRMFAQSIGETFEVSQRGFTMTWPNHALQRTPRRALGLFDNVWPAPRPAGAESLSLGR